MNSLVLSAGWFGDWFYGLIINLFLLLDNVVYVFINWMYRIFMLVAKVNIFEDSTVLEAIVNRVYIIVGIAMLFIFAYNLILLIVNPDGKQLGNMANVVKKAIVSIIVVIFLPLIFNYLTTIQNHILESNVLGRIILGASTEDSSNSTNKKSGVETALIIFSAFYHPEGESLSSCRSGGTNDLCQTYVAAYDNAYQNDDISSFVWNDDLKDGAKKGDMEYNFLISTAAGVFALWMFLSFALDIGVRVGKMAFYEIISPIPVMMRILPNDKMFDKWFEGIKKTYISLFVRLIVIYFCMYAISLVPDIFEGMRVEGESPILWAIAECILILGILKFAQEAPKLVSDLFGGSGDLKFGVRDKYKYKNLTGAVRGGVYGATTADAGKWNRFKGFMSGAGRGGMYGYDKGIQKLDDKRVAIEDGSTWSGRMTDRMRNMIGMQTRYDAAGADAEKQMKKEKIEKRREHNKVAADAISTLKDKSKSIVEDKDSVYRSTSSQFSDIFDTSFRSGVSQYTDVTDTNGNTYSMNGKNYSEMKTVLDKAIQDGASQTTLNALKQSMTNFQNNAKASGKTYNLNDKNSYEMKAVLDEAIRNKASAETVTTIERAIAKFEKEAKDTAIDEVLKGNTSNIQARYKDAMVNAVEDLQTQVAEGVAETINVATGELTSGVTQVQDITQFKAADQAIKDSDREMFRREHAIKKQDDSFKAKRADRDYINKNKKGDGK